MAMGGWTTWEFEGFSELHSYFVKDEDETMKSLLMMRDAK